MQKHLTDSRFFAGLASDSIEFLVAHARVRTVKEAAILFRYGERANSFYLITSGHIAVEVAAIAGPPLELQDLGPGSLLGWSWLIAPHRWSFQARAKTPAELIEFDGDAVLAECEVNAKFGYELFKRFSTLMSERLQHARERMIEEWRPPGFA